MQDVVIKIRGTQTVDGEPQDVIEMMTEGFLEMTDSGLVLKYSQQDEDMGSIHTTVSVEENAGDKVVTLDRTGDDDSRMTIQKDHRHTSLYSMGEYKFTVGVFGERVLCDVDETGGKIDLSYTIDINSAYAGRNEVGIVFKTINNN